MNNLGRIPEVTDSFAWGGLLFEVLDMDGRRVDKLLVRKA
jgi:putative hemolysin